MMEQELNITETDWGLHIVTNEGDLLDDHNHLSGIKYVLGLSKEKGKNKILIVATTTTRRATTLKLLEGVVVMRQLGGYGFQTAIVAPHLVNNADSKFVNDAAYNRGIFIRYFFKEEEAMKWLLNKNYEKQSD